MGPLSANARRHTLGMARSRSATLGHRPHPRHAASGWPSHHTQPRQPVVPHGGAAYPEALPVPTSPAHTHTRWPEPGGAEACARAPPRGRGVGEAWYRWSGDVCICTCTQSRRYFQRRDPHRGGGGPGGEGGPGWPAGQVIDGSRGAGGRRKRVRRV